MAGAARRQCNNGYFWCVDGRVLLWACIGLDYRIAGVPIMPLETETFQTNVEMFCFVWTGATQESQLSRYPSPMLRLWPVRLRAELCWQPVNQRTWFDRWSGSWTFFTKQGKNLKEVPVFSIFQHDHLGFHFFFQVQMGSAVPISTTGYAMEPMPYTVDAGAYTIQGRAC